jgi:anti-sigma factor RsiW
MTHSTDGDLIRWLDGELDDDERSALEHHVGKCEDCAALAQNLRQRSGLVHAALRLLDPAPVQRRVRAPLAWAAGVLLLLGVGAGVPPVRAWIIDQTQGLWASVTGAARPTPTLPAPVRRDSTSAAVTFVPASGVFVLEVGGHQASGRLTIERSAGSTAVATVIGGDGDESFVVLPAGLRIENAPGASASYWVRLPATVSRILVVVGTGPPIVVEPQPATERWQLDLADSLAAARR